jgi:hypothetical protein
MKAKRKKTAPTWNDVKARLAEFERSGLLGLVQDLYAASKDNQNFLHARFGLGSDILKPYQAVIDRWLYPDMYKNFDTSVAKAKRAVADYTKAIGQPEGMAELMVFYCERAASFCDKYGVQDESYHSAMARMFDRAAKVVMQLAPADRDALRDRLYAVLPVYINFGLDVIDDLDVLVGGGEIDD